MKMHMRLTARSLDSKRTIREEEVIWYDDDLTPDQALFFVEHLAQFHYIGYLSGPWACEFEFRPVKQLSDDIAYN